MNIPNDLVIISNGLFPSDLDEDSLAKLIYAKWFKINDTRVGDGIAVSEASISGVNHKRIVSIEDAGFAYKSTSFESCGDMDKKWNEIKGFFI